jgi:D-alanine-D-alanine ligase-like ATP-grasp enzyme
MNIQFQKVDGYLFGAIQPSALIVFDTAETVDAADQSYLEDALTAHLGIRTDHFGTASDDPFLSLFVSLVDVLNRECGDQRFTDITIRADQGKARVYIPTLSPALVARNVKHLADHLGARSGTAPDQFMSSLRAACVKNSREFLPSGTNAGNFIAGAAKHKIPFRLLSTRHIVFGYGPSSTIFDSSIIEDESAVGVALSKSKVATHNLLALSGIPVARQWRVTSARQCAEIAARHGFPVVLKPVSEDQGRGVIADIRSLEELTACFDELSRTFDDLILEQHVAGEVYRVNTFGDQAIRVVHRQFPAVTGTGTQTIRELIDIENADPSRGAVNSSRKKISINDELVRKIGKQGLTLESIPQPGQTVRLSAGVSGGVTIEAADGFHPENLQLCVEAAKAMRLSLSGVDFISLDPSVPWFENGAVICEVNSQPQLGVTHQEIYGRVLFSYMKSVPEVEIHVSNSYQSSLIPLFNKAHEKIVIRIAPDVLVQTGSPSQYFTSLNVADDVLTHQRKLIFDRIVSVPPELGDMPGQTSR